jgi:hypothetical protein
MLYLITLSAKTKNILGETPIIKSGVSITGGLTFAQWFLAEKNEIAEKHKTKIQ